jgi:hypothetical protein
MAVNSPEKVYSENFAETVRNFHEYSPQIHDSKLKVDP